MICVENYISYAKFGKVVVCKLFLDRVPVSAVLPPKADFIPI